jgi:hypothetical protein
MGRQEMYVAYMNVITGGLGKTDWSSTDFVNEMVQYAFRSQNPEAVVDGGRCLVNAVDVPIDGSSGAVFVAKNKATLVAGLRLCDRIKIVSRNRTSIGYIAGSYDNEKNRRLGCQQDRRRE